MKTISEISQNISSSDEFKHVKDRLVQLQKSFRENFGEINENSETVERYYEAVLYDITKRLSQIRQKDIEKMKVLGLTCDTSITTVTAILDELETLTQKGEEEQIFFATRKAESQLPLLDERLSSVRDDNKITRYTYVQDTPSGADRVIGRICEIEDKITPVKLDDINVKTPSDTSACWIIGIDRLSDNILVLADRDNRKIKLVDMTNKTVTSEFEFNLPLWDLTRIDDKRIAITTSIKKIFIVSISDTLTIHRSMHKREFRYCQGIVYSNDTLIVSYHKPDLMEILDLEGRVKQTIEITDRDGTVRGGYFPFFAHRPDTNTFYLSDNSKNKVHSMKRDSKILSSYTHEHLKGPTGITVGRDGRIFVCSCDSNKIYEITSDLSKGQIILDEKDGISRPHSITCIYHDKEHKLFVGSRGMATIQVFRV